jgi:peptide/nickel transport system substrate-binding protein
MARRGLGRGTRLRGLSRAGLMTGGLFLSAGVGAVHAEKVAVVAIGNNILNLNPLTPTTIITNTIFDGLTRVDDESHEPKPSLAESWTVNADQREYVFRLRRGVVFHDGSPFTADDARFSLEMVCHKDNLLAADLYFRSHAQIRGCPEYREGRVGRVEGIEVLDSHTLRVRLTEPRVAFLVSAATTGVLPLTRYGGIPAKALAQHPLSRAPIGTGPFSFVEWTEGDRLVLKANPRYFLGRPKLDGLVIRFIEDPATRFLEFKNGSLHFGFYGPVAAPDFAAAAHDPRLVPKTYRGNWHRYFAMDLTNPLFADVRVRQALSHAFDRERILQDVWDRRGRIVNGPLNPAMREFNPRIPVSEYDPTRATRLLGEAGWHAGPDGALRKDGRRFEFTLLSHGGASRRMAVVYQDYLRRIGMDARIETVDYPTFWGVRFRPGQFQAASFEMPVVLSPDPAFNLGFFQCGSSRGGYCSREGDALIAKARSTLDPDARARVYWRLQEVLARDLPFIWIVTPDELQLASSKLVLPDRPTEVLVMMGVRHWDLRD